MIVIVPQGFAECRLDRALELLLPELGLRGRRRICEDGRAYVNGIAALSARKVRPGDEIEVAEQEEMQFVPEVIASSQKYAALFKPAGIHTESLAGRADASLQSGLCAALPSFAGPRLLDRLDKATSGIIMAADGAESESGWHRMQDTGLIRKRYLAVACGICRAPFTADGRLILTDPKKSRVELAAHPDPLRHTHVTPLGTFTKEEAEELAGQALPDQTVISLLGCLIFKGGRHQIRAHLASFGLPLLGDVKYGGLPLTDDGEEHFFLHHGSLSMPEMTVTILPGWLPDSLQPAAEAFLKEKA